MMIGTGFWTIILVHLLGCMSPGPDFILVVKQSLSFNQRTAIFTVLGVSSGILMHSSYCALGLGLILANIPWFFQVLKIVGAVYLVYLAIKIACAKNSLPTLTANAQTISPCAWQSFKQGFFCNALNPKAMLFILGLFIMVTKFHNSWWSLFFVIETTAVTFLWFALVVYGFSHPSLKIKLLALQSKINKCLALFLVVFAMQLLFGNH